MALDLSPVQREANPMRKLAKALRAWWDRIIKPYDCPECGQSMTCTDCQFWHAMK